VDARARTTWRCRIGRRRIPPTARDGPPERFELLSQFVLVASAALLYFGVRGLTQGSRAAAVAHGLGVLRFERMLGIDVEATAQSWLLENRAFVTLANWVYIWGHWPVIVLTLLWLHRRHRGHYLLLRNAMFASGAIGLVIFATDPVAPPRLLAAGLVDTVTELSNSYRVLQPPALVNKYAAVPSLHVGWNLLVGIVVFRATANRFVRFVAVLSPVAMFAAVVLTANHYLVDGLVGMAVALVGLAVSARLASMPAPSATRRRVRRRTAAARGSTWGNGPELGDEPQVVDDEPGHAPAGETACSDAVVDTPGEERVAALTQPVCQLLVEEVRPDRVTVDPAPERQPAEQEQLEAVASRSDGPHAGSAVPGAQHPRELRRDGQRAATGQRGGHGRGRSWADPLQVDEHVRRGVEGFDDLLQGRHGRTPG
jgi:hypothetical protein